MREIKFRGKRLDNGEWVVGSYIEAENRDLSIAHQIVPYESGEAVREVDPDTVGQYVWRKDKRGNEIYEGDILALPANRKEDGFDLSGWRKLFPDYVRLYVIAHNVVDCGFGTCLLRESAQDNPDIGGLAGTDRMYIIGNIHDNTELLKTE